jgi:hypothetical protein
MGNCPEAVIGQATINLDSQVWKSLQDSLPKLYCVDLAEAYVMQEGASLRNFVRKKGMNEHLHEKPLVKGGNGKQTQY